jgi:hypothetical protein
VFREIESKCSRADKGLKERAARFLHDNSSPPLKRERRPAWKGPSTLRLGSSEKVRGSR